MKPITLLFALFSLSLLVSTTFACSGLSGEYKLMRTVKDRDSRNNCAEGLVLSVVGEKLVVMDSAGTVLAEITNKKDAGQNNYLGVTTEWTLRERLKECSADSSFNSESWMLPSSIVKTQNLRLSLSKSDKLKVRSLNYFGNSTLNCDYLKL